MPVLSSVLLVDDDRTANFLHKLLVTNMGIAGQVLVAEDGQQALAALAGASAPPALILLDLNMPVLNGLDFLTRYAQLPPVSPRPVVALLSSSEHSLDQARTQHLPVDAYLSKPLTREKLQGVLQQYFPQ
jgi:CheY-like chemotaxis protein